VVREKAAARRPGSAARTAGPGSRHRAVRVPVMGPTGHRRPVAVVRTGRTNYREPGADRTDHPVPHAGPRRSPVAAGRRVWLPCSTGPAAGKAADRSGSGRARPAGREESGRRRGSTAVAHRRPGADRTGPPGADRTAGPPVRPDRSVAHPAAMDPHRTVVDAPGSDTGVPVWSPAPRTALPAARRRRARESSGRPRFRWSPFRWPTTPTNPNSAARDPAKPPPTEHHPKRHWETPEASRDAFRAPRIVRSPFAPLQQRVLQERIETLPTRKGRYPQVYPGSRWGGPVRAVVSDTEPVLVRAARVDPARSERSRHSA
jgi:hypothetical protein